MSFNADDDDEVSVFINNDGDGFLWRSESLDDELLSVVISALHDQKFHGHDHDRNL